MGGGRTRSRDQRGAFSDSFGLAIHAFDICDQSEIINDQFRILEYHRRLTRVLKGDEECKLSGMRCKADKQHRVAACDKRQTIIPGIT